MQKGKFKSVLKIVLYILIIFACQQISQNIFPELSIYPDFFFVLIWTFSYFNEPEWSILLAIIAGVMRDILFGRIFGLSIILGILGIYLARHLFQFVWQKRFRFLPVQIILLSVITNFLETLALNILNIFQSEQKFSLEQVLFSFKNQIVQSILLNLIAMLLTYLLISRIIPFIKKEKDVYAEDVLKIKGEL